MQKLHPDELKRRRAAQTKRWRKANPEHCRAYSRQKYKENKEKHSQTMKEYYQRVIKPRRLAAKQARIVAEENAKKTSKDKL